MGRRLIDAWDWVLLLVAIAFAWSIGAHYTGACMGMAYAAKAVRLRTALLLMVPATFAGAALASGAVEATVGGQLLAGGPVAVPLAVTIVAGALILTTLYNSLKLPTSTIQILVFSVAGAGLAAGVPVRWDTIGRLLGVWVVVPPAALALGYVVTRLTQPRTETTTASSATFAVLGTVLVTAGVGVSFVMGANDVSNASGAILMTGLLSPLVAAMLGGAGLVLGILTWGRPLLVRVAFETVSLDRRTSAIAQFVQGALVLSAVVTGYFTSLNQALVGAMAGTGLARGRQTVNTAVVRGIVIGWAVGPGSGLAVAYGLTALLRAAGVAV